MKSFSQFNELKRPTIVSAPIKGPNQDQSGESPSHSTADYTISDEKKKSKKAVVSEGFDKTKPAHVAARKTVSGMSSLAHAEFHDDGSATVHTKSNKNVSSVRVVDHHHDVHGLGYNRPAKTYNKYSRKKDGLTHSTKKTGPDSHEIYIKEEVELDEAKRGRPPKNKSESDPGSDNIIMQLRKVITLRGQNPVTFVDGRKAAVSPSTAHRLLAYYDNLRTTGEKHSFAARIHKSAESMRDVIAGKKEIVKPKISLGGYSYKGK